MNFDDGENVLVRFHRVKASSPRARLIELSVEDAEGVWIPESQIAHIDEDAGELWIPEWLAEKKGLEYE